MEKEKKVEERERKQEETEDCLQAQRKTLGEAIAQAMKTSEQSRSSNKAPPPPAPTKTAAPPENITQGKQLGIPPNSPKQDQPNSMKQQLQLRGRRTRKHYSMTNRSDKARTGNRTPQSNEISHIGRKDILERN